MPNNLNDQTVFIPGGDPETMNEPTLYAPGNLGARITYQNPYFATASGPFPERGASKSYQVVRSDSSDGIAPTRGAVMYWKDKARYIVTTDPTKSHRNHVAGVAKSTITAGNFMCVQFKGDSYVQVTAADTAATVMGDKLIGSAADAGRASRVAAGTAPTHTVVGTAAGPVVGGNLILTNLEIPETT